MREDEARLEIKKAIDRFTSAVADSSGYICFKKTSCVHMFHLSKWLSKHENAIATIEYLSALADIKEEFNSKTQKGI